jgi:hypothetical protein
VLAVYAIAVACGSPLGRRRLSARRLARSHAWPCVTEPKAPCFTNAFLRGGLLRWRLVALSTATNPAPLLHVCACCVCLHPLTCMHDSTIPRTIPATGTPARLAAAAAEMCYPAPLPQCTPETAYAHSVVYGYLSLCKWPLPLPTSMLGPDAFLIGCQHHSRGISCDTRSGDNCGATALRLLRASICVL